MVPKLDNLRRRLLVALHSFKVDLLELVPRPCRLARAVVVIDTKKPDSLSSVGARSDSLKKLDVTFRNLRMPAAERLVEPYTAAVSQFDLPSLLLQKVNVGQRSYQVPGLSWSLLVNAESDGILLSLQGLVKLVWERLSLSPNIIDQDGSAE